MLGLEPNVTFDVLLACLFPIAVLLVGYRLSAPFKWANLFSFMSIRSFYSPPYGNFSLETAYQSYTLYGRLSHREQSYRQTSYNKLGRAHKRLGNKIGYQAKLDKLKVVTDLNATITDEIADLASKQFNLKVDSAGSGDLGRVRESLKHFIRDWSQEGANERQRIFQPILNVLQRVDHTERKGLKVLVPGSGLGRLAWEISQMGFDTTANELSFFMNLALRFLLSPETTPGKNEHVLRPYAHWFSHQRNNDSLFRAVPFPDAVPRITSNFHLAETDFLSLRVPPRDPSTQSSFWLNTKLQGYDYIVTLFFIDTSLNVLATMEHIYALLRPGGMWINLGPLLWTSGGPAKLELSLEEVLLAAEEMGFIIQDGSSDDVVMARKTIDCEYTGDLNAMMRWTYKTEFWVATKSK